MKQMQFYKYATWGLLILNVSMVAFFFLNAPPHNLRNSGFNAFDILQLDKQQHNTFLQFAQQHIQQMDNFNRQQKKLVKSYFNSQFQQDKTIHSDSLFQQIQMLERQKIESVYQHLQDIKSILKPDQYSDFEIFTEHAIGKILFEQKKNAPPPKDFE